MCGAGGANWCNSALSYLLIPQTDRRVPVNTYGRGAETYPLLLISMPAPIVVLWDVQITARCIYGRNGWPSLLVLLPAAANPEKVTAHSTQLSNIWHHQSLKTGVNSGAQHKIRTCTCSTGRTASLCPRAPLPPFATSFGPLHTWTNAE